MGWLRTMTSPFSRMWSAIQDIALFRVLHHPKRGRGVGKLYNDVCSCQYDDIHVMWSMLEHSTGDAFASPKGGYRVTKDFIL
ncbi:unnamed protein product [Sphagnum jensenii]|uniref:Uncharacterized protein n=2 Tax=Sphagnum jensenii TaxID=128206 RepID=A0ABP0VAS7_9BRYO